MIGALPTPEGNQLLAALSDDARSRLAPHLELVSLRPGDAVRHVYFPTSSIVSLLYTMENEATAEIAVVGYDGLVGIALYLGGESTPRTAIVQSPGCAYRLPRQRLKAELNRHGELLTLILRYTRCLTAQMAQTTVCNGHHTVDQQFCRWLLLSLDRLRSNTLAITHDVIARMLGAQRNEVIEAAGRLHTLGVLQYSRGRLTVIDRRKLELVSCECYSVIKSEADRAFSCAPSARALINERGLDSATAATSLIH
jgi:CRP-like cAMP-binding protein